MKPILFNTEMVRAILDGRKTVTRRVVKPKTLAEVKTLYRKDGTNFWRTHGADWWYEFRSPCVPGDILWVRETWCKYNSYFHYKESEMTNDSAWLEDKNILWRPSIYMPREAARIFLQVKEVRVERLLTPFFSDGATVLALRQEGMALPRECVECIGNYGTPACIDASDDSECGILDEIRGDFSDLWDRTMKPADLPLYGWEANPWVWVIEFERISKAKAIGGGGDAN